jgi:DNA helicase II / ATP-dependent DNA helicase PcrA
MPHPSAGARDPCPDAAPDALLARLTADQARAVRHGPGPLPLLAGPGAGKTRTLIHRIAHLLAAGHARPSEILAVTFSVRAASELRLRPVDLLGEPRACGVTVATVHSICARILREHAAVFGRTEAYTIYDQADMRRVIEWLLSDAQRSAIQALRSQSGRPAAAEVLEAISLAKNRLLSPEDYERAAHHSAATLIAAVWRASDVELARSKAWSFDDLLVDAVRLLAEHPHRLAHYRQRWRWLVVDEMQDTNPAQATLLELLAGSDGNLTCCGDDDQAIYGWRGADPRGILAFAQRFPTHTRIVLGHSFRSRSEILNAAVACVAHNPRRAAKALIAVRGPGGHVAVRAFANEHHEAHWVAGRIADELAAGTPPREILVLARTGYATQTLQSALARAGIPHRVLGSLGLYERSEVRDALAYLALLVNPADAQAFRRAIQSPRRGIGAASANRVITTARSVCGGDPIAASARAHEVDALRAAPARDRLISFGTQLAHIRDELASGRSLGHVVVATALLEGGLVRCFERRRDRASSQAQRRDAERVLEDLRSLCRAARSYEDEHPDTATLTAFLDHAAGLHAHQLPDGSDPRITVSTVHHAKGSEARLVVLLACEEQLVPSWRAATPRPRAAGRGAPPVLRRLHARQGPTGHHPRCPTQPASNRRPLPLPHRRAPHPPPGARRLTPPTQQGAQLMPTHNPATPSAVPPATTHHVAARMFRRPFAPGAIGFRAMTRTPLADAPHGGAHVAAYLNAQSIVQRLNAVVPAGGARSSPRRPASCSRRRQPIGPPGCT